MSTPSGQNINGRLRRPKPTRTEPHRNILGAFLQNGERSEPSTASSALSHHPLGLQPDAETQPPHLTTSRNQDDIRAAAGVIDRHISEGKHYEIPVDDGMWGRLSGLAGGVDTADLADIAKLLTRSYSELAAVWIEIAGKLRETLGSSGNKGENADANVSAPALVVQSSIKVSAKVQMLAAGAPEGIQPLIPEDGSIGITDISLKDGQIEVFVHADARPGRYHSLVLGLGGTPLGAVTITVPEPS